MLKIQTVLFSSICICLFSCIGRQAYYVSPFNGITNPYHSIPMHADSIKSASYLNTAISLGGANEGETDPVYSFTGNLSRSNNFGIFQAYYGAGLTVGSYKIKPYDSVGNNNTVNYTIINQHKGNYFFGGGGFDGGINFVTGSENFEWRIFGIETSLRQEFGKYVHVRNNIPDSAATVVVRNRFYGTFGMFTEIVGKGRRTETGCKLGFGGTIGSDYHNFHFTDSYFAQNPPSFGYFTLNVHTTANKWTGYIQGNFAKKAAACLIGMNYRISK
jgi:hypothetical protein